MSFLKLLSSPRATERPLRTRKVHILQVSQRIPHRLVKDCLKQNRVPLPSHAATIVCLKTLRPYKCTRPELVKIINGRKAKRYAPGTVNAFIVMYVYHPTQCASINIHTYSISTPKCFDVICTIFRKPSHIYIKNSNAICYVKWLQ
jgi:hypothetical protein